jgi:exosortase/archaeosortase family protein
MDLFIADACSGLRMLTIFCALAVAMVFLIERPWWDKFIILLSAVPIALVVNIVRFTVTGLLYMWVGPDSERRRSAQINPCEIFPTSPATIFLERKPTARIIQVESNVILSKAKNI